MGIILLRIQFSMHFGLACNSIVEQNNENFNSYQQQIVNLFLGLLIGHTVLRNTNWTIFFFVLTFVFGVLFRPLTSTHIQKNTLSFKALDSDFIDCHKKRFCFLFLFYIYLKFFLSTYRKVKWFDVIVLNGTVQYAIVEKFVIGLFLVKL